jgi:hypothetical protein
MRVAYQTRGVRESEHVHKLFVRKPGDPRCDWLTSTAGPLGEGQWRDQPPAEFVEKKPPAEGNRVQAASIGTLWAWGRNFRMVVFYARVCTFKFGLGICPGNGLKPKNRFFNTDLSVTIHIGIQADRL